MRLPTLRSRGRQPKATSSKMETEQEYVQKPSTLLPVDELGMQAQAPANVFVIYRSLDSLYAYRHEKIVVIF